MTDLERWFNAKCTGNWTEVDVATVGALIEYLNAAEAWRVYSDITIWYSNQGRDWQAARDKLGLH
jgi:hypothetical protein